MNACVSYLFVQEVSQLHKVPLENWITDDISFKFISDNVDKKVGVRDVRLDTMVRCITSSVSQ